MGIEDLLEAIQLVADNIKIKANPEGTVMGTVIEASVDKNRGVIATLLVQNGTLQAGDAIAVGMACGNIRAMFDYKGRPIKVAEPSTPVQVLGLNDVPNAGDIFQVCDSEREARAIVNDRKMKAEALRTTKTKRTLEDLFSKVQAGEMGELRLIVKADVQGSLEPIIKALNDIDQSEIKINVLYNEAGNITENDVLLATASNAIILVSTSTQMHPRKISRKKRRFHPNL
jgi:translation initiation factor IF-2